jgi:hypothetical protein
VGANGERTGLLYSMVAINGAVAFAAVVLLDPFLIDTEPMSGLERLGYALGSIVGSVALGGACAGMVLLGAKRLERQAEHQHLLILGTIVLGVGTAVYLGMSVFLPMLIFGILVSTIDRERKVIAIRIASDARVFLVIKCSCLALWPLRRRLRVSGRLLVFPPRGVIGRQWNERYLVIYFSW